MTHKLPILVGLLGALSLAACGGGAAPASSPASPAASPASVAASKPAASTAASSPASAKPAASTGAAASSKPAASGAGSASAKPAASGQAAAGPPAAVRTPVIEVAKVAPGPPSPASAAFAAKPAAERPPLPAKYSQPVGAYSMSMEVIASAAPSTSGLLAIPGCVADSVFKRGMRMVWRFELYDMASGKRVTDRDGATAKIEVPNAPTVNAYFFPRGAPPPPPDAPWSWVGVWSVPPDYALGGLNYDVVLSTKDGKATTLKPADFGALPTQIVD